MEPLQLSRADLRRLVPKVVRHGGLTDEAIADREDLDLRVVQLVRRVVSRRSPATERSFNAAAREMRENRSLCG